MNFYPCNVGVFCFIILCKKKNFESIPMQCWQFCFILHIEFFADVTGKKLLSCHQSILLISLLVKIFLIYNIKNIYINRVYELNLAVFYTPIFQIFDLFCLVLVNFHHFSGTFRYFNHHKPQNVICREMFCNEKSIISLNLSNYLCCFYSWLF
jgi:hypothetical protein